LSIRQSDHKATVHRVHVSLLEDDKSGIGEMPDTSLRSGAAPAEATFSSISAIDGPTAKPVEVHRPSCSKPTPESTPYAGSVRCP
jgi:hypothetical protein